MSRRLVRPARRLLLFALALLAVTHGRAFADDAGTRSIFQSGSGLRALGMGSAFVAIADDASAAIWNPGGLGLAPRLEASAAYTGYYNLGMSQTDLGLTLPSWRWGAAGFSLRQFGAQGIEQRDDRNVLLSDNLTDSETELALAYGHSIGETWGLGGTIKFQRQSLAGWSGSGMGADLGVLFRPGIALGSHAAWMQNWSVGLAARNLLEPSVRLVQESVPDPTTLQTGVAYQHSFAGARTLLASMDLERTQGMSPRFHTGLELRLFSELACRAGLDGSTFTAGTDIGYHDFAIQYVFENRPLGAVQRIGVSHALGSTVAQSRLAAQQKEEREVQARLDEAFQQRQTAQAGEVVAQAVILRDQGRFDEALEALATAAILAPSDSTIVPLQLQCLHAKARALETTQDWSGATIAYERALIESPADSIAFAGRARCRAESDRLAKRSEELRRRYDDAFEAFVHGNLTRARQGFAEIVASEPNAEDARAMLQRTDEAIAARAAAAPEPARPAPAPAPATAAAPVAAPLSKERQREIETLYRRGEAAMAAHQPDDAMRYWEFVWSMSPGYEHVADYLKREYLLRGMELFSAGKLDDAAEMWRKALKVDPNDARANAYLARVTELKNRSRALANGER